MKIDSGRLYGMLQNASQSVARTSTIPILSCAYMVYDPKDGLTIEATDLEGRIKAHTQEAYDGDPFKAAVNLDRITKTVRLIDGILDVSVNKKGNLLVKNETSKATIKGWDAADYPPCEWETSMFSWDFPVADWKSIIKWVCCAGDSDGSRPMLSCVYIHTHEGQVKVAATDGTILCEAVLAKWEGDEEGFRTLIPISAIKSTLPLFDKAADDDLVTLSVPATSGEMSKYADMSISPDLVFRVTTMQGNFPDYKRIIDRSPLVSTFQVLRDNLVRSVKLASLYEDGYQMHTHSITVTEDGIEIVGTEAQEGHASSTIGIRQKDEQEIVPTVGKYVSKTLIRILEATDADRLVLSMPAEGVGKPTFIEIGGAPGYLGLIMPVAVSTLNARDDKNDE